jgi:methionyl-tRNA formyltransferase
MKIVFMGTPDFAVESLKNIVESGFEVVGVVTMPDKNSGRGQKLTFSPIKVYALSQHLRLLQPEKLKNEDFLAELRSLNANIQVVVAFRMLPEAVWDMPKLGTINLHASLLPNYRGAAPINWAIINGEKITGNSTFFLEHEIDTGKIIYNEEIEISKTETAGTLHDKLMISGAKLLVKTLKGIESGIYPQISQTEIAKKFENLKKAPKIFKDDCKINWQNDVNSIYNFIRGLSPYPAAFTELYHIENKEIISVKLFETEKVEEIHSVEFGKILTDDKTFIKISCLNGFIFLKKFQLAGKKPLSTQDFLKGNSIKNYLINDQINS